jgi:retinoid hydroxylase
LEKIVVMTNKLKSVDMMPGNDGLPIIGDLVGSISKQELFYWQQHQKHGNIFKVSLPIIFGNIACLIGVDANRLVLKDGADKLSSRLGNKGLEPVLTTDTVLLKDGEEHRTSRKMILPVFHRQAIASYFDTIQSVVTDTIADWGKRDEIDLAAELSKLTLTVVVKIFLGSQKTAEIQQVSEWFTTLVNSMRSGIIRWDVPFTAYGKGQSARRKINDYIRQIIQERAANGDLEQSTDVLSLLLNTVDEHGNKFTETEVINQAIGFLFAGQDTTSSLMSWLLFELGNRPEWRQRLRDEQQQVMGNEPISMTNLRQLPNMSNAIKEGERLYPPAFTISRMATEDLEYGGYLIPAGWYVCIFPMLTHLLPEIYQDPDLFDPDRFAPPREEDKKQPYSLIGFGGGVHSCIGVELAQMEMKIILSTLLQKYDWTVTPTTAEISPVRRPFTMQKQLKAKFVPLNPLQGGVPVGRGG